MVPGLVVRFRNDIELVEVNLGKFCLRVKTDRGDGSKCDLN